MSWGVRNWQNWAGERRQPWGWRQVLQARGEACTRRRGRSCGAAAERPRKLNTEGAQGKRSDVARELGPQRWDGLSRARAV